MNIESYVGSLMVHTPKAVRRGEPADRVLAVVSIVAEGGEPDRLLAWKCVRRSDGTIQHPAFNEPLRSDDPRLFVLSGENGSEPTALFSVDSHVRRL